MDACNINYAQKGQLVKQIRRNKILDKVTTTLVESVTKRQKRKQCRRNIEKRIFKKACTMLKQK